MRCRTGGFTLTEAIVAIVILSVAMPPLLWALQRAHADRASQVLTMRAVWLAAEGLEDVVADYHASGFSSVQASNYPAEDPVPGFQGFSRAVSITRTQADLQTPGNTHARVAVRVSFQDGRGKERTVEVETVLASLEP